MKDFPRAIATVVGTVLGRYYYSHRTIETLLYECGASGEPPEGNCEEKITRWLMREAKEDASKAFTILGKVLEEFMDTDITRNLGNGKEEERSRLNGMLRHYGLEYREGGRMFGASAGLPSRALEDILRERNLPEVHEQFERAIATVDPDPPSAVTAACSILESLCKVYIQDESLDMPSKQTLTALWSVVSKHLGLSPTSVAEEDLKKILSGLFSIVDGISAFRTHTGSAHGRGRKSYRISGRHARFVVHAAHSLATFIIETWDDRKTKPPSSKVP